MEIIEKEKIVEHQDGYYGPNKRDINGKANAGLTLGIIGTALGAWALFGNRRASAFGGLSGGGGSTNINVNGIEGMSNGLNAPTAFQAWEKGCEDTLALQSGLYNWALTQQNQRFQSYLVAQVESLAKTNPMIGFTKPLITRALNKNLSKLDKALDLIADENGNIEIEGILEEMIESVVSGNPFKMKTPFMGDVEIGGGLIKLNVPLTDKSLVFNESDLLGFKEILTAK